MLIRKAVVPAALLLALTAGCANNAPIGAGGAPEPAPASSSAAAPVSSVSAAAGETSLTGTLAPGVEPKCLLLKDGSGDHLLIIEDEKLRASVESFKAGAVVTVTGKASPGQMTTCMQGEPFLVSSVAGS
jgi:hypothetical protein